MTEQMRSYAGFLSLVGRVTLTRLSSLPEMIRLGLSSRNATALTSFLWPLISVTVCRRQ